MPTAPFNTPETIPGPEDRDYDLHSHRNTVVDVGCSNMRIALETMGSPVIDEYPNTQFGVTDRQVAIEPLPMPVYPPDLI